MSFIPRNNAAEWCLVRGELFVFPWTNFPCSSSLVHLLQFRIINGDEFSPGLPFQFQCTSCPLHYTTASPHITSVPLEEKTLQPHLVFFCNVIRAWLSNNNEMSLIIKNNATESADREFNWEFHFSHSQVPSSWTIVQSIASTLTMKDFCVSLTTTPDTFGSKGILAFLMLHFIINKGVVCTP